MVRTQTRAAQTGAGAQDTIGPRLERGEFLLRPQLSAADSQASQERLGWSKRKAVKVQFCPWGPWGEHPRPLKPLVAQGPECGQRSPEGTGHSGPRRQRRLLGLVCTPVWSFQYCSSYSPPSESRPPLRCGHRALSTGTLPTSSSCPHHSLHLPSAILTSFLPSSPASGPLHVPFFLPLMFTLASPAPSLHGTLLSSGLHSRHLLAWPRNGVHPVSVFPVPSDACVFPSIYPASCLLTACLSAREDPPQAGLPEGWSSVLHSWVFGPLCAQ